MSDEVKLLPCPFPHEIKRGPFIERDTEDFFFVRVSCGDCGCAGPYVPLGVASTTVTPANEADAIRIWNSATRPPIGTDEVVERVARALYQTTACEAERTAPDCSVPGFDEDDEDARQFCRALARAAIAAMKDAASD